MQVISIINPDNVPEAEALTFEKQEAVRAIVFNKDRNKIATQYSANHNYHKLPGGGLEGNEDLITALKRECREELGYGVEVEREPGEVIEYRKNEKQKIQRISHYYVTRVIGEQGELNLDAGEMRSGFVAEWLTPDEAVKIWQKEIMEASEHRNNRYILPRDLYVIKYFISLQKA